MRRAPGWLTIIAGVWLLGCAGSTYQPKMVAAAAGEEPLARYTVKLDSHLERLEVSGCFVAVPARHLRSNATGIGDVLGEVAVGATRRHGAWQAVPLRGEGVRLDRPLGGQCVHYVIPMTRAMEKVPRLGRRHGRALLLNGAAFLLRPSPLPRSLRVTVRFELPAEMIVSTGWPSSSGDFDFETDASVFRFLSHVAIGDVQRVDVEVANATLRIVRLPGALSLELPELVRWMHVSADVVSQLSGAFPVPHAMVAVLPTPPGESPVAFGNVGRGGGSSLMLLVRENASFDRLARDWVAPHEFSHLMHPFVQREDLWLSEGIATYYQEVLQARAGMQSERQAWQAIANGFRRGKAGGTGRTLQEESRDVRETHAYPRVYWAGAALVLASDVRWRQAGTSFDQALVSFAERNRAQLRPWSAAALAASLDRTVGVEALVPAMNRTLSRATFPSTGALLEFLGIRFDEAGHIMQLDDRAAGAHIRRAIMAP